MACFTVQRGVRIWHVLLYSEVSAYGKYIGVCTHANLIYVVILHYCEPIVLYYRIVRPPGINDHSFNGVFLFSHYISGHLPFSANFHNFDSCVTEQAPSVVLILH